MNAPSTSAPPKHSDTSDGEETIQAAYDSLKENNCLVKDYVVKKTEVDIHHTMDSQLNNQNAHTGESLTIFNANDTSPALNVDTEATLTAEEDDQYTIEIDNNQNLQLWSVIGDDNSKKRDLQNSSDDEDVFYNVGNFVNSSNPFGAKDKKKAKQESSP